MVAAQVVQCALGVQGVYGPRGIIERCLIVAELVAPGGNYLLQWLVHPFGGQHGAECVSS
ncbi:hypothetical protein [Acetobacter papayae]|uniref:hypothetical protein n=1 Tax=Acetobacter papayae TaxID=1076592 RepID=UPI000686B88F|nr:hypothetical protein [Acetobacter papayae]